MHDRRQSSSRTPLRLLALAVILGTCRLTSAAGRGGRERRLSCGVYCAFAQPWCWPFTARRSRRGKCRRGRNLRPRSRRRRASRQPRRIKRCPRPHRLRPRKPSRFRHRRRFLPCQERGRATAGSTSAQTIRGVGIIALAPITAHLAPVIGMQMSHIATLTGIRVPRIFRAARSTRAIACVTSRSCGTGFVAR